MLTAQVPGRSKARLVLTMQVADINGSPMDGVSTAALVHRHPAELERFYAVEKMVRMLLIQAVQAQGLSRHQVKQRLSIATAHTLQLMETTRLALEAHNREP